VEPLRVGVVCEARADCETATGLADRVLREVEWIDQLDSLEQCRTWHEFEPSVHYLAWSRASDEARERRIKAHGHFGGEPGAEDAGAARRAILVLRDAAPELRAILLIRDSDGVSDRRRGLEQARGQFAEIVVVIGLAHPMRECWVLAGFEPRDDGERQRYSNARQQLGFCPCEHSERLTAKHDHDKASAKRVLGELSGRQHEREAECWRDVPLATLEARGSNNGLRDYLGELRARLMPRIASRRT
jgi:hypothetical protein